MSKRNVNSSVHEPRPKMAKIADERLIFTNSPVSLEDMAAIQVAIVLWYHQNIRHQTKEQGFQDESGSESTDEENYWSDDSDDKSECRNCARRKEFTVSSLKEAVKTGLDSLIMPPISSKKVRKYIDSVGIAIDEWVVSVKFAIFFDLNQDSVYKYTDEIIWQQDGEIDYIKTARNLIDSPRTSQIEKYRISCVYCFEDELKNVSPRLLTTKYIEKLDFYDHPTIFYWNCVAKGELNKIPLGGSTSIESCIIEISETNRQAMLYFFDRLSDDKKIHVAKKLIKDWGSKYQRDLINRLNEESQYRLFMKMGVKIVNNFLDDSYKVGEDSYDHALSTWIYIQNLVTEEQFAKMVYKIAKSTFYQISGRPNCHMVSFLMNVWESGSKQFKLFALDYDERSILNVVLENKSNSKLNFTEDHAIFLLELLSVAERDIKEYVIRVPSFTKLCEWLTKNSQSSLFINRLITLCLTEANESLEFRNQLLQTDGVGQQIILLFVEGKLQELNKFISHFIQDQNESKAYIAQLMTSEKGIRKCIRNLKRADITSFKTTIQHILPEREAAENFITSIVSSEHAHNELFSWVLKNDLNKLNNCLKELLPNETELNAVKNALLQHGKREDHFMTLFRTSNTNLCQEFLLWCLSDEQRVLEFKNRLDLSDMFHCILADAFFTLYDIDELRYCEFRTPPTVGALEQFLLWYFITPENVKKFKIKQIFAYRDVSVIGTMLQKKDKSYLKTLLNWFFENDKEQIRQFKSRFSSSRIAQMI